jgi:hypothetical protein
MRLRPVFLIAFVLTEHEINGRAAPLQYTEGVILYSPKGCQDCNVFYASAFSFAMRSTTSSAYSGSIPLPLILRAALPRLRDDQRG